MKKELLGDEDIDDFDLDYYAWDRIPSKDKKELIKVWKNKRETRHYIGWRAFITTSDMI